MHIYDIGQPYTLLSDRVFMFIIPIILVLDFNWQSLHLLCDPAL